MFNIPAPGAPGESLLKGFDVGSSHMSRLLHNKLQQAQMAQQAQQFMQNFGLQQAQENRAAELHPLNQQYLQAQTLGENYKAGKLAQEQQLMQAILGGMDPSQMNMGNMSSGQNAMGQPQYGQQQQANVPQNPALGQPQAGQPGLMLQNQGQMAQGNPKPYAPGNLMNNPLLAGYFKHITGVDPYMESPEMKSQRELNDFANKAKWKEEFEQSTPKNILAPAVQAKLQEQIISIQRIKPELVRLRNMDPQTFTYFRNNKDKAFNSAIFHMAEGLTKGKDLPNSGDSIKKMEKDLAIGASESPDAWRKRMDHILADLDQREEHAMNLLNNKKTEMSDNFKEIQKKYETTKKEKLTDLNGKTLKYNPKTGKFE